MGVEHALDLGRVDVLAARYDHVLHPVVDVEEAVGIEIAGVAGVEPTVADALRIGLVALPVPLHHQRAADQDLPDFVGGALFAGRTDDAQVAAEYRLAAGAEARAADDVIARRQRHGGARRLGEAVRLHEVASEHLDALRQQLFRNRRGAVDQRAQRIEAHRSGARMLQNEVQQRRHHERVVDVLALDQLENAARVGLAQDHQARPGVDQRQRVAGAADVIERHADEAVVAGPHAAESELGGGHRGAQVAVRQLGAFRMTGGAAGVELPRGIALIVVAARIDRSRAVEEAVVARPAASGLGTTPGDDRLHRLQAARDLRHRVGEIGADEEDRRLGVVEDERHLRPGEAPVDRRVHTARLADAEDRLDEAVVPLVENADALPGFQSDTHQRVADETRALVELAVRRRPPVVPERRFVALLAGTVTKNLRNGSHRHSPPQTSCSKEYAPRPAVKRTHRKSGNPPGSTGRDNLSWRLGVLGAKEIL